MDHITSESSYRVDFASSHATPQPKEHDLPTSTHSIPYVHSMVGEDASASVSAARPLHLRNYHPNCAATCPEKRATRIEDAGLPRSCKKTRGKNKAHRLRPSAETDELAFPLHFDEEFRIIGPNAERFGQYIGQISRRFTDFPLHLNWCAHHERSFKNFFLEAQKDYEFLPHDPYCPLNLPIIYRGIKTKMQERVRGNRNQVKTECYELWLNTPEEKRRALFKEKVFEGIDEKWWNDLCKFYSSKSKQAEAKRNKVNRESKKRGRATYTGGSRSMVRAKQRVRAQIEESCGSSSALKEYLGTHATLMDPTDSYSCIYPDTQTQEYCDQVIGNAKSLGVDQEPKFAAMTKVLDEVHGGHHGGYERGLGHGVSRFYLTASSTPIFVTPDVLREMAELKSKMERLTQLIDSQTTRPPSVVPATTPPTSAYPSPDAQGSTSAAQCSPQDISTRNPLASRLGGVLRGVLGGFMQEGYSEEDIRKAFADYFRLS